MLKTALNACNCITVKVTVWLIAKRSNIVHQYTLVGAMVDYTEDIGFDLYPSS
jgi:hypothetical protein